MNTQTNRSSRGFRIAAPAILAAVIAVGACSDATGPSRDTDTETQSVLANGPALGGLISNESARVLPGVTSGVGREELVASLNELSAALHAGLGNESRAAVTRFYEAVDRFEVSVNNPNVAAELGALRHAVEVVQEAVAAK